MRTPLLQQYGKESTNREWRWKGSCLSIWTGVMSDDDADTEDCVLVLLGQESPETDWIELHYSTFNARLRPTGARGSTQPH